MKPILFHAFGVAVPSYSVLMVLGYVVALGVLFKVTPRSGDDTKGELSRPQVWDLFIVMVVSSVLGSKIGHVLFESHAHPQADGTPHTLFTLLRDDPLHWIALGDPGYVWYGGMIGALLVAVYYFRNRPHLDAWLYSDAFAPAIMAGAAVGRLGCFLAGCCHGVPTDSAFGVHFPKLPGPVHPTQLYDSATALVLAIALLWRFGRRRFDGENIALLLMSYPVLRATTEVFRGDAERGSFGPLSTSQLLSIPLFLVGLAFYVRRSKAGPATAGAGEAAGGEAKMAARVEP
ncbi:prolipoprotein diacylglyceryl transferase [Myxococcota bacterium]|nr:prolipoprotein diacylglyceryl transferase [Myxococcota bacterium]